MQQATSPNRNAAVITEEVINSVIHGIGAVAALMGVVLGLILVQMQSVSFIIGFVLYGICLVVLMLLSTLYHALTFTRARGVFRIMDHNGIFLLIAGSYTPFLMYLYSGWAEIAFLAFVWGIATASIVIRSTIPTFMDKFGMIIYISLGWVALLMIPKLPILPGSVLVLLMSGGVLYTVGASLFAIKKPFMHCAWHLFVLVAAVAHYFAIIQLA